MEEQLKSIELEPGASISAIWHSPSNPKAALVLAHGAGAGMSHQSMNAIADGLAERDIATLRYNFPYMENGSKRPDKPAIAHEAVRAAITEAATIAPDLPLFAGGKSFGGRMTSQAQAISPLPDVRGLIFFAFPLHPAGKPGIDRADHLADIDIPMLFLQGTRDKLADLNLLKDVTNTLGPKATLVVAEEADHSFHVPKRSGRTDDEVLNDLHDVVSMWIVKKSCIPSS